MKLDGAQAAAVDALLARRAVESVSKPSSLLRCFGSADGEPDFAELASHVMKQADAAEDNLLELLCDDQRDQDDMDEEEEVRPKKRRKRRPILAKRNEEGELEVITPRESWWYTLYVECPNLHDERFHKKFRRRFRMPYEQFCQLVEDAVEEEWFPRWMKEKSSPIELLLLGSLRYLGRGFTFDDCEESTAISEEVHRVFFHQFINIGSTILFDQHVRTPVSPQEAAAHTGEFEMAGFPGCVGSSDATHITIEKCSQRLRQFHKGGKSKSTTRSYNMTVNHRRLILGTTRGHPGRWNDKTVVLFDTMLHGLKRGKVLADATFELLERNKNGEIVPVKYRGAYVIVDNGYLAWSTTVPPFKRSASRPHIRFSEWLESMRKDVECAFGIMKGRWRVLKTGIRLHGTDAADKIWATCCALHNWLLEVDGLNEPWDGVLGEVDAEDLETTPFALRRLASPSEYRNYDTSGIGPGEEEFEDDGVEGGEAGVHDEANELDVETDGVRDVAKMSLMDFREKLVIHFNVKFSRHEIKWPKRDRVGPAM